MSENQKKFVKIVLPVSLAVKNYMLRHFGEKCFIGFETGLEKAIITFLGRNIVVNNLYSTKKYDQEIEVFIPACYHKRYIRKNNLTEFTIVSINQLVEEIIYSNLQSVYDVNVRIKHRLVFNNMIFPNAWKKLDKKALKIKENILEQMQELNIAETENIESRIRSMNRRKFKKK